MQVTLSTYLTIVSTLSINPIFLCSSQKSPIRGPAVNPTSQDLETSEMSNPPSPVVPSPSLTQSNHDMLTSIRSHLDDQEVKIQEQLFRFQGIKRAIDRICKNDEAYMDSPDIVKAQTTLEDRPELERKGETAAEALRLLKVGNAAFLRDEVVPVHRSDRHIGLHFAQKPHAIIIACSDSRVPPEMIFNCAFGEL